MKKALRVLRIVVTVSIYFLFGPFGYLAFFIWCLLPTKRPERRARRLQSIMRWAFSQFHRFVGWMRLIRWDQDEVEDPTGDQPCVIVANHPTLTDTTALMVTVPNTVTVVKPSIFRRPMLRPLMKGAYFFEGPGKDHDRLKQVMEDAQERLEQGFNVLLFPEGTRSPEGGMHPFGRLPFEIACRANVPVQPFLITCTPLWLTKEHPIFDASTGEATLRVTPLEQVHPSEVNHCSRTMRQLVRDTLQDGLLAKPTAEIGPEEDPNDRIPRIQNQSPDRRIVDARGR